MHSVALELGSASYSISVEHGLRHTLADLLAPWNNGQRWVVLTQAAIFDHYQDVITRLQSAGYNIQVIIVPGDESAKNIRIAEDVWTQMVDSGCDRSSVLLAMGGGVVGDLGGFVASTYMRGIAYIQLPTTLLAMIDSAIGGKTAVNLKAGKNLVGAIYQPKAVLVDPEFLSTLPKRNVISSLAEALKYGLIRDPSIFETMESRFDDLVLMRDPELVSEIIFKSCAIKAQIVSNDQFENGERRLLNYGHTVGHAFETLQGFGGLYHGEAVAYGMKCANFISHRLGLLGAPEYERAQALLNRFELPKLPRLDAQSVLDVVAHDKKAINGTLNFIVIDAIGNGLVSTNVGVDDIVASLEVVQ